MQWDGMMGLAGSTWLYASWFLLAAIVLDFFDITMPRGDSVPVSGALCAAAVVLFGPVPAGVIALGSALVAQLTPATRSVRQLAPALFARLFAIGAAAGAARASLLLGPGSAPAGRALLVPATYLVVELAVAQLTFAVQSRRPALRMIVGNLVRQAPLLLAETSVAALTIVIYPKMGAWGLIPVVALLLLIRQSYTLLLDIRETYRNTVEVLVEAAEAQDKRRRGHGERTAAIARSIGQRVGLSSSQLELLSYAALLHDIDAIAGSPAATSGGTEAGQGASIGHSAAVFDGVDFFANVRPIISVCDGGAGSATGVSEACLTSALIVALASDVDVLRNPTVGAAHSGSSIERVAPYVPSDVKARAVAAAVSLGYKIPAVG